ncbi:MAG: radical SAM protein [Schwartzia sp.]|nr:radical SAM protein [Schwartzia sp. (in: firmicutes)]
MQMERFLQNIRNKNKIVIFGRGDRGTAIYKKLRTDFPSVNVCFCDSLPERQGPYLDTEVLSVEEAVRRYSHELFLLTAVKTITEMYGQLREAGVADECIVRHVPPELLEDWEAERQKKRMAAHTTLRFEVNVTKHCNLNCKGCDHFAPLADASDCMDFNVYLRDMQRISELFGDKANEIHILGGEPMLHPELKRFLQAARELFPSAKICLDTNGTLLPKVGDDFWKFFHKQRIVIEPTMYPVPVDYEELARTAERHHVEYQYLQKNKPGGHHTLWKCPLDLTGGQDPTESFIHCGNANRCITLENGRLYTCSIASNMYLFNRFFGNEYVQFGDQDGIDIYQAQSAEEIFSYLARPMPVCRYCDVKDRTMDHPWEVSRREITEWT